MAMMECTFDGIVGPTHNYAGLSHGNVASASNRARASNPRKAALQGLDKAWFLARRGYPQAVLPPHERPAIRFLREWGITGPSDQTVLERAAARAPLLLAAASSASAMWTANACTMSPSSDTADGKVHFTPANLQGNLHRAIEAPFTTRLLRAIFADGELFTVHEPLPGGAAMADEGAANHTRLCGEGLVPGIHLFVYGRRALDPSCPAPKRFPARQTHESVRAIAARHGLEPDAVAFVQQHPRAIDAGVFHNDVISMGTGNTLLYHEAAFLDGAAFLSGLKGAFEPACGRPLHLLEVSGTAVSLEETVRSYLFNSQLLPIEGGRLLLVAPGECRQSTAVASLLETWIADPSNPVDETAFFDLRESMRNGGGPACLRQRVVLTREERAAMRGRLFLDKDLHDDLTGWIKRHYREELRPEDLADPLLLAESRNALDELTRILDLPPIYPFQG